MHDLNVVIVEERVDRVNKELILHSRRRTIRIKGNGEEPAQYSRVKVSTEPCKDDSESYLIRIKAYRNRSNSKDNHTGASGGGKKKQVVKFSTI